VLITPKVSPKAISIKVDGPSLSRQDSSSWRRKKMQLPSIKNYIHITVESNRDTQSLLSKIGRVLSGRKINIGSDKNINIGSDRKINKGSDSKINIGSEILLPNI